MSSPLWPTSESHAAQLPLQMPPELLGEIAGADAIHGELGEDGSYVSFAVLPDVPRVSIELHEGACAVGRELRPSEAIALAAGDGGR